MKHKKYGEIARFRKNDITYIIHTTKIQNKYKHSPEPFVPFLAFYRTLKSAKHSKCNKRDKWFTAHSLEGETFNQSTIRNLISEIQLYLIRNDVRLFCFSVFDEETYEGERRLNVYSTILNRMGFRKVFRDIVEEEGCCPLEIYYFEKQIDH